MSTNLQDLVDRLRSESVDRAEVLSCLEHKAALVRSNAIEAASRLAHSDSSLIPVIADAASHPKNRVKLLGTTTVGQFAVACLLKSGIKKAEEAAQELINNWPHEERLDLMWYLDAEGLLDTHK